MDSQSSSRDRWSYAPLKNFRQISPVVQTHLKKVYLSLCCAWLAFAVGVYLHFLWNVGSILSSLGCIGCIFWLEATPFHLEQKKISLLMAAAFLKGASMGPVAQLAIDDDASVVFSTLIGILVAFDCLLVAAMLARRREYYLYVGGFLSSGLSILLWMYFASSTFEGSMALFKFELYFGLLVFVGHIVVNTKNIIEKARLRDLDYVNHALKLFSMENALSLFTYFVVVLVGVLTIMLKIMLQLKNTSEKEGKRKEEEEEEEEELSYPSMKLQGS